MLPKLMLDADSYVILKEAYLGNFQLQKSGNISFSLCCRQNLDVVLIVIVALLDICYLFLAKSTILKSI